MSERQKNFVKTVISLVLSCININLAVSLEEWPLNSGRIPLLLFYAAGFPLCFLLTAHFLRQSDPRLKTHSLLWGILMTTAYVLGCRMRRDGTALSGLYHLPALLLQIACLSVFAASCIAPFLQGFPWIREKRAACAGTGTESGQSGAASKTRPARRTRLCATLFILACWTPVFLAYYPSVFAYDAEGQLYQVLAHDYSTHHPLLHTIFLGAFFRLGGGALGSYSAGMAVHSVVQMLLMAWVFGYTLSFLAERGVSAGFRTLLLLFYALFPANSILALSTTKDVLFSALVLLHTLCIYRLAEDGWHTRRERIAYVLWTALMLLFRNNARYAIVLSVPVLCILIVRKKRDGYNTLQRYLTCTVLALCLFAGSSVVLNLSLHARSGSPREMLSVPLQQMARTRVKAEETLSPGMREELDQYLSSEWVFAAYNPYLADPVKRKAVIHGNPVGLIKTWIRLGLKHPQIYIDAFLDNSIGYWFLEDKTHAQIYGIGTESGFGYLSTDNRVMPAGCEIIEHSYLPKLRAAMEQIVSENVYQKMPVLRIIFAPAFYWWLLCLYMAIVTYRRQYVFLLPAVFLVCYYLTLLLSPTVLIRYMYPFVVTVPVLCCCLRPTDPEFRSGGEDK